MGSEKKIWEASGIGGKEKRTTMGKRNTKKYLGLKGEIFSGIVFNITKKNPRGNLGL